MLRTVVCLIASSQPERLPESSRGSKRSAAPRNRWANVSHPEGVPAQFCDPFRVKIQSPSDPGVSLRSTPGYYLPALRAALVLYGNNIFDELRNHIPLCYTV
jgi:hypothetical protein